MQQHQQFDQQISRVGSMPSSNNSPLLSTHENKMMSNVAMSTSSSQQPPQMNGELFTNNSPFGTNSTQPAPSFISQPPSMAQSIQSNQFPLLNEITPQSSLNSMISNMDNVGQLIDAQKLQIEQQLQMQQMEQQRQIDQQMKQQQLDLQMQQQMEQQRQQQLEQQMKQQQIDHQMQQQLEQQMQQQQIQQQRQQHQIDHQMQQQIDAQRQMQSILQQQVANQMQPPQIHQQQMPNFAAPDTNVKPQDNDSDLCKTTSQLKVTLEITQNLVLSVLNIN